MSKQQTLPKWLLQLEEELDYQLLVCLRDGRAYIGTLRSFDQYGNLLLDGTRQRLTAYDDSIQRLCYSDIQVGCLIIRGDNLMLFGRLKDNDDIVNPPTQQNNFPVPVSSVTDCQMIERSQEDIMRLIIEEQQESGGSKHPSGGRNFLWFDTDCLPDDTIA